MNNLSLRPGLWTNQINSKVIILIFDYKSFSEQLTLPLDPQQVLTIHNMDDPFQNLFAEF